MSFSVRRKWSWTWKKQDLENNCPIYQPMQHLLLLHGALGAKDQLAPLEAALQKEYTIHTLNFTGHGGEPIPEVPFSIPLFAQNVLQYLAAQRLEKVAVFGYSMGGYVGMYLARHHAAAITKLVTLGTKFFWDEDIAARQQKMFNVAVIEEKAPELAAQLQNRHAPQDWKQVVQRTASMLTDMGNDNPLKEEDYSLIQTPILLTQGDRDKMIPAEEILQVYRQLPTAQWCILPTTPHPFEQVNVPQLLGIVRPFLGG